MTKKIFLLVLAVTFLLNGAYICNGKTVGKLELYPTIECIGVTYSDFPAELQKKRLVLDWRITNGKWQKGAELVANPVNNKLRASIFPLSAGKTIEVRVMNKDTVLAKEKVKLRSDKTNFGYPVKSFYVSPSGNDENDGSKEKPFKTIYTAMDKASPGTEIIINSGIYHEAVLIRKSGKPGAYITLKGAGKERPVITGASRKVITSRWKKEKEGLFSIKVRSAIYASIDGKRIYCYPSFDTFMDEYDPKRKAYFINSSESKIRKAYKALPCSMAYNKKRRRMFFRFPQNKTPNDFKIEIASEENAVAIQQASFIRITNLKIKCFNNAGIRMSGKNSHDNVIDNCVFEDIGATAISIRSLASDNLVEKNNISEPAPKWPWGLRKATVHETSGINLWRAGGGNVIRENTIDMTFNGISACTNMNSQSESEVHNTDIYRNLCKNHGDDAIEPEGSGVNCRIFSNKVKNSFVGISLAPINVGPTYVVRNLFLPGYAGFKLQNGPSDGKVLIYHNTCFVYKGDGVVNHNRRGKYVNNIDFKNNIIQCGRYIVSGMKGNNYDNNIFYTSDKGRFVKAGARNKIRAKNLEELEEELGKKFSFTIKKLSLPPVDYTSEDVVVIDKGVKLRGFNNKFKGNAPDMGYKEIN